MAFGTTTAQTGVILSFLVLISLSVLVLVALGKEKLKFEALMLIDLFAELFLIYIGWLPAFVGTVLALIWSLVGAYIIRGTMGR